MNSNAIALSSGAWEIAETEYRWLNELSLFYPMLKVGDLKQGKHPIDSRILALYNESNRDIKEFYQEVERIDLEQLEDIMLEDMIIEPSEHGIAIDEAGQWAPGEGFVIDEDFLEAIPEIRREIQDRS